MNYTENYHLPQWEESDRILRADFNEAMAGIEAGISTAQSTADEAAAEAAKLPYVIGSYAGTGFNFNKITLGFKPSAVLVAPFYSTDVAAETAGTCSLFTGSGCAEAMLLDEDGFRAMCFTKYPDTNRKGVVYLYIAFR